MLRRNGPVMKSVESVLRLEGSLWRERFVEEVGLELVTDHVVSFEGEACRKERSAIRNEDDVGGRARVTRDEERALRAG